MNNWLSFKIKRFIYTSVRSFSYIKFYIWLLEIWIFYSPINAFVQNEKEMVKSKELAQSLYWYSPSVHDPLTTNGTEKTFLRGFWKCSEMFSLEFRENLEEMLSLYHMHSAGSNVQSYICVLPIWLQWVVAIIKCY